MYAGRVIARTAGRARGRAFISDGVGTPSAPAKATKAAPSTQVGGSGSGGSGGSGGGVGVGSLMGGGLFVASCVRRRDHPDPQRTPC